MAYAVRTSRLISFEHGTLCAATLLSALGPARPAAAQQPAYGMYGYGGYGGYGYGSGAPAGYGSTPVQLVPVATPYGWGYTTPATASAMASINGYSFRKTSAEPAEAAPESIPAPQGYTPPAEPAPPAPAAAPEEPAWHHSDPLAGSACGEACHDHEACNHEDESGWRHRTGAFIDYLYLSPRGVEVPYAQPVTGVGGLAAPLGELGIAELHYRPSYRIGGEVALTCDSGIGLTYTELDTGNTDRITAPPIGVFQSLVSLPPTNTAFGTGLDASADYRLRFKIGEADFVHTLWSGRNWVVNGLVGASFASMTEDFRAVFTVLGMNTTTTRVSFSGAGPRVGADGEYAIAYGFSAFTRGTADFVVGRVTAEYHQLDLFAGDQGDVVYRDKRIVPVLELDAGLKWTSPKGHFQFAAGYLVNGWFDTVTVPGFIQAVQNGSNNTINPNNTRNTNFTRSNDNLNGSVLFDGLFGRIGVRY